jgi:hypothetical protein
MSERTLLGPILRLQIKRSRLTKEDGAGEFFDPSPLLETDAYRLTPDGAMGRAAEGWLLDRHHQAHPENPLPNPKRALSIGFSAHYQAMEERFGTAPIGIAGENLIVDSDRAVTLDMITGGIEIETGDGTVVLVDPEVAEPCVPFTRFMMQQPNATLDELRPDREFLRRGMRGFVVGLASLTGPAVVHPGDLVWARSSAG